MIHIKFGIGKILNIDNGEITVDFDEGYGQKVFLYPEVFEDYLKMRNPSHQEVVLEEIKNKRVDNKK